MSGLEQRERGFGQVPFVGDLPFVVGFDEHRARQAQQRSGVGKTPTTSVQRLTSLFNRSSGWSTRSFPVRDREIGEGGDVVGALASRPRSAGWSIRFSTGSDAVAAMLNPALKIHPVVSMAASKGQTLPYKLYRCVNNVGQRC